MPRKSRQKKPESPAGEPVAISKPLEALKEEYGLKTGAELVKEQLAAYEALPLPAKNEEWTKPGETPLQAPEYRLAKYEAEPPPVPTPDDALPSFPLKVREPFPHAPEGFEARGTFEAAGVRVNRHGDGTSALQFKDGAAMSFEEKLGLQAKGYSYVPGDKQWANPQASWLDKVNDARAISDVRLKDRER